MENKSVLITGGSSGIGTAIAKRLSEQGAKVAILARRPEAVDEVAGRLGVLGIHGDVTKPDDCVRAVSRVVTAFGGLTTVVNSAGVIGTGGTADTKRDEWERIMSINLDGTVNMCRASLGPLKKSAGGSIVNLSSVTGTRPIAQVTAYCVSKAAVDMMTKCAALELGPHGIRVAAVAPGRVDTPLLRQYQDLGLWDHIRREQMRSEFTQPVEIANVFAFLASDEANCINGSTICADDGFINFKYPLLPEG